MAVGLRRPLRPSTEGLILFATCGALAGSAFRSLRFEAFGLLFHPYLFGILVLAFARPARKLKPLASVLPALALFVTAYAGAALQTSGGASETIKVVVYISTVAIVAGSVRNRRDYELAVLGLSIAVGLLALGGLAQPSRGSLEGINPLPEVANTNAFSIYALPAILLAANEALRLTGVRFRRVVLAACTVLSVVAVFSTRNRSGYLGVVLVAVLLVAHSRRVRQVLAVGVVCVAAAWLLLTISSTAALMYRLEEARTGYRADDLRRDLITESWEVAIDNPLLGVGPQQVPEELAQRLGARSETGVDSHNLIGHLAAGTGFVGLAAFIALLVALWRLARRFNQVQEFQFLLRALLTVWLFRGLFSREVLYSPAFALATGAVLGLAVAYSRTETATQPTVALVNSS